MYGPKEEKKVPEEALEVATLAANIISKYIQRLYNYRSEYGITSGIIPLNEDGRKDNPIKAINDIFLTTNYKFTCLIRTTLELVFKLHPHSLKSISVERNKDPRKTISAIRIDIY